MHPNARLIEQNGRKRQRELRRRVRVMMRLWAEDKIQKAMEAKP